MTYCKRELLANGVSLDVVEIRAWRREHELTQAEMALLAGVNVTTLSNVETGRWPMTDTTESKLRRVISRWSESMRPVRKPDGRRFNLPPRAKAKRERVAA